MSIRRNFVFYSLFLISFLFAGCGVDSQRFRIEGRLRNMNQGEFWVYSPEGAIVGIDTIRVHDSRFTYETDLRMPATFVIIFPNFSELPIFAEPGEEVTLKGDASRLKELIVKGTDDNDDMTKVRQELNTLMPPDVPGAVEKFIRENPASRASNYLLQRYFLQEADADYKKAYELVKLMLKEQPDDGQLIKWEKVLKGLRNNVAKGKVPNFSATDINGRVVSQADLNAKVNVLTVWALWNFNSTDIQRRLLKLKKKHGDKLGVVSICLDGNVKDVKQRLERDSVTWKTVCDGNMWQSPLVSRLGVTNVPTNWLMNSSGTIVERNMNASDLEKKIEDMLQ